MKNEVLVVELRNPVEAFLMFWQREPAEEFHTIADHQLAYPFPEGSDGFSPSRGAPCQYSAVQRKPRRIQPNTILYLHYQPTSGLRNTTLSHCEQSDIGVKEEGSQRNIVIRLSRTQEIGFHFMAPLLRVPYNLEEC